LKKLSSLEFKDIVLKYDEERRYGVCTTTFKT